MPAEDLRYVIQVCVHDDKLAKISSMMSQIFGRDQSLTVKHAVTLFTAKKKLAPVDIKRIEKEVLEQAKKSFAPLIVDAVEVVPYAESLIPAAERETKARKLEERARKIRQGG